jgi:uncharacterized protein YdeI (YjbR/CyaY-like superfamily)
MANLVPHDVLFPTSPEELRAWLEANHDTADERWVGFRPKASGLPTITWPELVDEVLCVGWIDGVRKRIDEERYQIRFTPRKPRSSWSNINIARVKVLKAEGRMQAAGLAAFAARDRKQPPRGSYEQEKPIRLPPKDLKAIRANAKAWKYYQTLPPGYVRLISWWVLSAKKPETRAKRLKAVIAKCAAGKRFTW